MGEHRVFFIIAAILAALIAVDLFLYQGWATLFLIRKTLDLIEYVKFWD